MNIASSEEPSTSSFIHCTFHKTREAIARNGRSIQPQTPRDDDNDHDCDEKDDDDVDETSKDRGKTSKNLP
jgi:hypothetical protein